MSEVCALCKAEFGNEQPVKVREKGLRSLVRVSAERELYDLHSYFKLLLDQTPIGIALVHHDCRRKFVDKRTISTPEAPKKKLRSSVTGSFDWKSCCFLCSKAAERKYSTVFQVRTLPLLKTLISHCENRDDDWGRDVQGRLLTCNDLVAEEAVYHITCMTKFRLNVTGENKRGRPPDTVMAENFRCVCSWLEEEADSELYTLAEVHEKMVELSKDSPCYSVKSLKRKLMSFYGDHIYFSELPGRPNLVCFKDMASFILENFKKSKEQTSYDIIAAAAKIIKSDIREMTCDKSQYPSLKDMGSIDYAKSWVPESLLLLLSHLVTSPLKQVSFGQCIAQAARPRSMIASIPFGVGVDIDKSFATKWFVDHLAKLGFSITSDEVNLFKQSASACNVLEPTSNEEGNQFTQWVADNVDHNICTLTGKGTFHGMGIISISSSPGHTLQSIKRLKHGTLFSCTNSVEILPYSGSSFNGLRNYIFRPVTELVTTVLFAGEMNMDLVWQAAWFFTSKENPRPNWSGFMQYTTRASSSVEKSSVQFLPIIDLNSSDETCIFSTLHFVMKQAQKLGIPCACITFDQPLWLKALGIAKDQHLDIVCRLGGFHMLMSFLGSIGNLMAGSGLEDVFSLVYAEHTVIHMMSGKAFSRSLRAHFLVQSSLVTLILSALADEGAIDPSTLKSIFARAMEKGLDKNELCNLEENDSCVHVRQTICEYIKKISSSRTAKLWLLYIDYIDIVKEFVLAERTCNWILHLHAAKKMINLFAATGHRNYAKSTRIYVQEMLSLLQTNPWLHQKFQEGQHAVRRSERYWAGLWTDLVIEQTLMRSIKSRGGLTRGRGFKENVRHLWVNSINYTAAVHEAMTALSGIRFGTSEQHLEMGATRRSRDYDDCNTFLSWFESRNPFNMDTNDLHSLSTGVVSVKGIDNVNCEDAEAIGARIHKMLDNVNLAEAKIKKKDQLSSLDSLTKMVKVSEKNSVCVNPTVLFTRLAAIAQREENVEQYFAFELTNHPQALFKNGLMRKPDKSALRKVLLLEEMRISTDRLVGKYVLDGGALLHRVHWSKGTKFAEIAEVYVKYVRRNYGSAIVIFDGYSERSSIKSDEHARRAGSKGSSMNVVIKEDNEVPYNKERFLSNTHNKTELISLLAEYLAKDGQHVHVCDGDADTKIVSTSLEEAQERPVIVVADDTDIAIMLLSHWNKKLCDIFLLQERGKKCWSIQECQSQCSDVKEHLLFVHAWSGCDSTSAILGKGKPSFLNLVRTSPDIQSASEIMSDFWAARNEVGEAAIQIFIKLYGGKKNCSLQKIRYSKYLDMVCNGVIEPEKLPPTEDAAVNHGLRVHLQIINWKMLDGAANLDPGEWGWKLQDGRFAPICTDKQIAPNDLLKVIRCNCKTSSKNQCGSNVCTCRKHGLKCMSVCGDCHGEDCNNKMEARAGSDVSDMSDDDDFDEEDSIRNCFDDLF